jgi:hypothetical protein
VSPRPDSGRIVQRSRVGVGWDLRDQVHVLVDGVVHVACTGCGKLTALGEPHPTNGRRNRRCAECLAKAVRT